MQAETVYLLPCGPNTRATGRNCRSGSQICYRYLPLYIISREDRIFNSKIRSSRSCMCAPYRRQFRYRIFAAYLDSGKSFGCRVEQCRLKSGSTVQSDFLCKCLLCTTFYAIIGTMGAYTCKTDDLLESSRYCGDGSGAAESTPT